MLTFLHIVYSKNRMEAWGWCAAEKSKKGIKNVDHMMWISHDIATVREFMFCKVRVWKGYFCNWLRKNWPTLTSYPHWTTAKYRIPPFCPPYQNFKKNLPLNLSHLKSWFTPFQRGRKLWSNNKKGGKGEGGVRIMVLYLVLNPYQNW